MITVDTIRAQLDAIATLERELAARREALAEALCNAGPHPVKAAIVQLDEAIREHLGGGAGSVTICLDHHVIAGFTCAPCADPVSGYAGACYTRNLFRNG